MYTEKDNWNTKNGKSRLQNKNTMTAKFASARTNVHSGNQSKLFFSFSVQRATSNEQGQRPQTLPLPTIVTMI